MGEERVRAVEEINREAARSRETDKVNFALLSLVPLNLMLLTSTTQQRMQMLESQLSAARSENKNLTSENVKLSGHHNNKQKIHYIENLKVQLQNLMDENTKLKEENNLK